jgi:hypothetical protein
MKVSTTSWPLWMRPLAFSRPATGTVAGITAFVAVSKTVSPIPHTMMQAYSSQIVSTPVLIDTAMTRAIATRTPFAAPMASRRSTRSTSMPAGKPNSSHGTNDIAETSAIRSGSRLSVVAIKGTAVRPSPSARLLAIDADQIRPKAGPRLGRARVATVREGCRRDRERMPCVRLPHNARVPALSSGVCRSARMRCGVRPTRSARLPSAMRHGRAGARR